MIERRPSLRLRGLAICAMAAALGACSTLESLNPFGPSEDGDRLPGERIALFPRDQAVGVDPALRGRPVPLPPPTPIAAWSQPGGTPSNLVGNAASQSAFGQVWSVTAGQGTTDRSAITAPPVVGGGLIYVLDAAVTVRAFDPATGGLVWERSLAVGNPAGGFFFDLFQSPGDDPEEGFGGGVAYAGGRVFVTTGFRQAHALDAATGEPIWTAQAESPIRAAPVAADGRVYVIDRDNRFVALDARNGGALWRHEAFAETASILGAGNAAATSDLVVVPYTNGDVFGLRAVNGRQLWNDSLTRTGGGDTLSSINDVAGRPVIDGNLVFAISHAGRFVAIDTRTGERAWTRDVGGTQTPWVAGEFVYVASNDGNLIAFEKRTGRAAWITYLGRWQDEDDREDPVDWTGPVMVSGRLVLTSTDGRMVVVSASDGSVVANYELSAPVTVTPIVSGDVVYLFDDDGELIALR